ncbi:hypothetical protein MMJ17_21775, partial [Bacillus spizizenii]|nr:hypothetical protein [Bacillus spizizenii]
HLSLLHAAAYRVRTTIRPLVALLISIFVPLKRPKQDLFDELKSGSNLKRKWFAGWLLLIRYLSPVAIIIVFLHEIGIF